MVEEYESVSIRYEVGGDGKCLRLESDGDKLTLDLSGLDDADKQRIKNIFLGGVGPGPPPCMVLNAKCEGMVRDLEINSISRQVLNELDQG